MAQQIHIGMFRHVEEIRFISYYILLYTYKVYKYIH